MVIFQLTSMGVLLILFKMIGSFTILYSLFDIPSLGALSMLLSSFLLLFSLYACKSVSINVNVLTLMFIIFLHFIIFMESNFLFILLVGDFMLCWMTLSFSLNHMTSKSFLCNLYLVYYVLIPSTPLLLFLSVQYANKGSQSSNLTLTESLFCDFVLMQSLMLLSSMAKLPAFSFHYWLPKAHVQASTPLSMILAGLSLKISLMITSFLFLFLNVLPLTSKVFSYLLLLGLTVSSFMLLNATDSKVFLAYSSVVHMSTASLGLMLIMQESAISGWLISLSHCISSPMLFYLASNTQYSQSSRTMKPSTSMKFQWMMLFVLVFLLLDLPFPPTFSFWSEVLIMTNLFAVAGFMCCLLFLPFISILRGYELFFQNKKMIFCQGITANMVSMMCILFFSWFMV